MSPDLIKSSSNVNPKIFHLGWIICWSYTTIKSDKTYSPAKKHLAVHIAFFYVFLEIPTWHRQLAWLLPFLKVTLQKLDSWEIQFLCGMAYFQGCLLLVLGRVSLLRIPDPRLKLETCEGASTFMGKKTVLYMASGFSSHTKKGVHNKSMYRLFCIHICHILSRSCEFCQSLFTIYSSIIVGAVIIFGLNPSVSTCLFFQRDRCVLFFLHPTSLWVINIMYANTNMLAK